MFDVDVESLPHGVIYVPGRESYIPLIGTFNVENIHTLINKVLNGRGISLRQLPISNLKLKDDVRCEQLKEEIDTSHEDDEILKEILEEERKKREQLEKEKGEEAKSKKKSKKKKKKTEEL